MSFDLSFDRDPGSGDSHEARGRVRLDDLEETFFAPLSFWSTEDYERQWIDAAMRLLRGEPACFVVGLDEADHPFGHRWMAWPKDGDRALFQDWLILPTSDFDPKDPQASVPHDARLHDDDGTAISIWIISIDSIREWLERRTSVEDKTSTSQH